MGRRESVESEAIGAQAGPVRRDDVVGGGAIGAQAGPVRRDDVVGRKAVGRDGRLVGAGLAAWLAGVGWLVGARLVLWAVRGGGG
ncbi:hypothetical protein GCM10028799_46040 [Kribbella italica]